MNPFEATAKSGKSENIQLQISRFIPAKPWRVLRMITRVQDFPRFMTNVRKAEILEKTKNSAVTHWEVEVEGLRIQWKEKDNFDFPSFTIHFELIEGDLEMFEGHWLIQKHSEGSEVTLEVSARLGIPIVEKVVSDILQEKLTKNFQMMLDGMEDRFITERYRNIGVDP